MTFDKKYSKTINGLIAYTSTILKYIKYPELDFCTEYAFHVFIPNMNVNLLRLNIDYFGDRN